MGLPENPDEDWKRKQAAALKKLLGSQNSIYSWLLVVTRNRDVARELVQETWVRIQDKDFTSRRDPVAFAVAIARNMWREHLRKVGRQKGKPAQAESSWVREGLPELEELEDAPETRPDALLEKEELERALSEALAELNEHARNAFEQKLDGFSNEEAAAALNRSPSRHARDLAEARRTLRKKLRACLYPPKNGKESP